MKNYEAELLVRFIQEYLFKNIGSLIILNARRYYIKIIFISCDQVNYEKTGLSYEKVNCSPKSLI